MDDYLDSWESVAESIQLIKEVITVHGAGAFEISRIRNFISSSREVLESRPEELRSMKNNILALQAETPVERTLGLHWDQEDDVFTFRKSCPQKQNARTTQSLVTKWEVLRTVMSIFDPLRFLARYLVTAKVLLQEVWRAGIGWNDELPTALNLRWEKWKESLEQLDGFRIPRCYDTNTSRTSPVELHVFCDASTHAYAVLAYVRVPTAQGFHSSLVMAKMRVALLKPTSVPRLELQAAVMGSRLAQSICEGHSLQIVQTIARNVTGRPANRAGVRSTLKTVDRQKKTVEEEKIALVAVVAVKEEWKAPDEVSKKRRLVACFCSLWDQNAPFLHTLRAFFEAFQVWRELRFLDDGWRKIILIEEIPSNWKQRWSF